MLQGKEELSKDRALSIDDSDFIFENEPARVIANRDEEKISLAGFEVGPFEEGREYEIRFWIAEKLAKAGIVRFHIEDVLNVVKLQKTNWKERVQPSNRVAPLSDDFYPKLRRYLSQLTEASNNNSEKLKEHEKSMGIARDIINCRLKKIVSLASSPPLAEQALRSLTVEERMLYHRLHKIISGWKSKILEARQPR